MPVLVGTEPTFLGIEDLTVTTGAENVDYLSGVTATDSNGNDLTDKIECDDSKADLSLAGEYEITYTVTDENGFTAKQTAKVTVADGKTSKKDTKSLQQSRRQQRLKPDQPTAVLQILEAVILEIATVEHLKAAIPEIATVEHLEAAIPETVTAEHLEVAIPEIATVERLEAATAEAIIPEAARMEAQRRVVTAEVPTLEAPHQVQTLEATTVEIQVQMERCQFQMILSH